MTTTAPVLQDYMRAASGKPHLGSVLWYGVRQLRVKHDDLVAMLDRVGLGGYAPRKRGNTDWFNIVCNAAKRDKAAVPNSDHYLNVRVVKVADDGTEILRRLVIEEITESAKRISYSEAYDVVYDRVVGGVVLRRRPDAPAIADTIAAEIRAEYFASIGSADQDIVRALIGKIINDAKAIPLRSTGAVFFAPVSSEAIVGKVEQLAALLPGCDVHSLPLVNDDKQAGMVKAAFTDACLVEIDEVLAELAKLQSANTPVTSTKYTALATRYKALTAKANAYAELLEDGLEGTRGRLEVLSRSMQNVAQRMVA